MTEAEQAIKLINGNGLIGILVVLLFFLSKSAAPAVGKVWDWFVSYFNPTRADEKEQQKKDDQDREARLRKEEIALLSQVYDGELLDAYKKNTEANVQVIMTMQAMQIELRASRQDLDDIKLDIAAIYAQNRQSQPSRDRRNATQPNQPLPTQEGKPHARNHQRNR